MASNPKPTRQGIGDWPSRLSGLGKPTEAMVDAAHEAASLDAHWAINSRRDFKRAVGAMIAQAQRE